MSLTKSIPNAIRLVGVIAVAATVVPVALASGEPKNTAPFAVHARALVAAQPGLGEAKNEWPFTRPAGNRALASAADRASAADVHGEAKNEVPFTRRVS